MTNALDGWARGEFTADGRTRTVFRRGTGPGVIVIHEIPGITPKVAAFANDLVSGGFTVVMPSLVGTPGRAVSGPYGAASMLKVCVAREFTHWALQRTSPIITWLRALAADLHASAGGPGGFPAHRAHRSAPRGRRIGTSTREEPALSVPTARNAAGVAELASGVTKPTSIPKDCNAPVVSRTLFGNRIGDPPRG